jgi:4-diphosphocytidyl-2-C-methyl-D-erythritol kinase
MAVAMALYEAARAKINLALHVTGRRGDGYHLLDSVVVFTDLGDHLTASPDNELSLAVQGPMAAGLPVGDNLVVKAAAALRRRAANPRLGARLVLEKHLPVASGIGGGSADAAAALRLLARLWNLDPGPGGLMALGAGLGADVPVCVYGRPVRMSGIGEVIAPLAGLPDLALVLVNPGLGLATSDVFARLERRHNAGLPALPGRPCDVHAVAAWLACCRNDLEAAAIAVQPAIAEVLAALAATPGCLIARMSGSGATCFGLFADTPAADAAARLVAAARPAWWSVSTLARGAS